MSDLFLRIVNMSISASWLVLTVLLLRFVFKKVPKWVNVLLWGIVAVRLICPFSIESALSLIPSAETIPLDIGMDTTPAINSGITAFNNVVNPIIGQSNTPVAGASMNPLQITIGIYEAIWKFGVAALLIYTVASYWRLRRKVSEATILYNNIFQCENVDSPFVLGIIRPKIYLPYHMSTQDLDHVVAHEESHIRRKDHWWKPLGFLLLTIHWFNPLMWLAYVLLCRDIELACDEKVIKELGNEQRADYTQALVACSVNRRMVAACPIAFGEVGVKERVKSVMNYKEPAFRIIALAVIVCVAVAVCFLTNPPGTTLTKWVIDEVDMTAALSDVRSMTVQFYGDSVSCSGGDINRFVATMDKIKVRRSTVSQSRDEARDQSFVIIIDEKLYLNFNRDFSELWVDDGVKPSFSYPIANPETAEELLLDFHFTRKHLGGIGNAEKWFDYLSTPNEMPVDGNLDANIPEFPDVTFRWSYGKMEAVVGNDIIPLYTGMPIWNAYFCDLTGDGLPELCSTLSIGSGVIDSRVIVYDYANGVSYSIRYWAESKADPLDTAISAAILDHYRSDKPDGLIHVESHKLLANEAISGTPLFGADNHTEKVTAYLLVHHVKYSTYGGVLEAVGGSYVPVAITFKISDSGKYILEEYWEPRDGSYYVKDIRDKFPGSSADDALNDQAYIEDLKAQTYNKALAYLNSGISLDVRIAELLDEIQSSPAYSSNPGDYIEVHEEAYKELLSYGKYTLQYCLAEFLQGGQTGLRGHIMRALLDDLAPEAQLRLYAETGQEYFDEWKAGAIRVSEQHDMEWIEKHQPAIWLLLQMIEE